MKTRQPNDPFSSYRKRVFAFLCPIVGLILGIIGATKYIISDTYKRMSIASIGVSVGIFIINFIILYSMWW